MSLGNFNQNSHVTWHLSEKQPFNSETFLKITLKFEEFIKLVTRFRHFKLQRPFKKHASSVSFETHMLALSINCSFFLSSLFYYCFCMTQKELYIMLYYLSCYQGILRQIMMGVRSWGGRGVGVTRIFCSKHEYCLTSYTQKF